MANIVEIFPSIQGEGLTLGVSTLFIRFSGCNLRCSFCDTDYAYEPKEKCLLSREDKKTLEYLNPLTPEKLVEILRENYDFTYYPVLALTGGEPLLYASFLKEFLKKLAFPGEVLLETNGTLPEKLKEVINFIDIVSQDYKIKPFVDQDLEGVHTEFLQIAHAKKAYVKLVVSPAVEEGEYEKVVNVLAHIDAKIPFILQPLSPINYDLEFILAKQKKALKKLWDVRVIPQVHKLLQVK